MLLRCSLSQVRQAPCSAALQPVALTTTFTASRGPSSHDPNMYKIAGELLPSVFHVSGPYRCKPCTEHFSAYIRTLPAARPVFAGLAETNPQEGSATSAVAHLATIKGRVPFINFFDCFRTLHEISRRSRDLGLRRSRRNGGLGCHQSVP